LLVFVVGMYSGG